jgi:type IV pilus assembly protein PilY1
VLGDIVDSGAVFVGPPSEVYVDAYNPGYAAFKSARAGRTPVVYVGANDGMLHAFNARVDSDDGGKELFALVPNAAFQGPDNQPSTSGLKALSDNGYLHHYYVNGTPFVRDVDFNRAGTSTAAASSDWRSLLVVGLGKGGRSYVALDVTDPSSFTSETAVAGKVLWEFTHEDMGFSYGRPMIVKTRKWGWVVIVAAGYNNTLGSSPGKGVLFVLNAKTGALLQKITTGAGSAATPAGLAHISGYVPDYSDMKLDQLYAGDLLGNLWRFDFTSASADVPNQSTPIAKLETGGTEMAQPITTEPLVEIASDLVRYVFVGTGRLLHTSDRDNTQPQTFYALRDGTVTNPYSDVAGAPNQLPSGVAFPVKREKMVKVTSLIEGVTQAKETPMGWYYDLTGRRGTLAEQIVINPQANEGLVSWIGTLMNQDKCNPAGESAAYAVKYGTAKTAFAKIVENARIPIEFVSSSAGVVGLRLVRYGSGIRLMGSFSLGESGPAFIGSQVGGVGDPRVLNWRIIGQ